MLIKRKSSEDANFSTVEIHRVLRSGYTLGKTKPCN